MSGNLKKVVSIDGHAMELQKQLNDLLDEQKFCDITLVSDIDGRKVAAHVVVLAAASNYLKSLIKVKLSTDSPMNLLHLYVSGNALESLVKYFYTGSIELKSGTVQEVYAAALLWQVNPVIDACFDFMIEMINFNNCFELLLFAKSREYDTLMMNVLKYIRQHFEMIFQEDLCLKLNYEDLLFIIKDDLQASNQEIVFKAIQRWINHDKAEREKHIDELVAAIQLPLLSMDFILNNVEPLCSTLKSKTACLNVIKHQVNCARNSSKTADESKVAAVKQNDEVLLAIDGEKPASGFLNMAVFNPITNKWYHLEHTVPFRVYCGIAIFESTLIIVGGWIDGQLTNAMIRLDLKSLKWNNLEPMIQKRTVYSIVVIDKHIYAIGGKDKESKKINTIECWNSLTNKWSVIKHETEFSVWDGVSFQNKLYTLNVNTNGTTIKCFDPQNNTWTQIVVIEHSEVVMCGCFVNGILHIFSNKNSHYTYDLELKTVTKNDQIDTHLIPLYKCVPIQNDIVACKGEDRKTLNKYNPKTKEWTELPSCHLLENIYEVATVKTNDFNWSNLKSD